jgi:sulfane dehydrogenase subunit SoxC
MMNFKETDRRRFLKATAGLAGVAAGAGLVGAKGQTNQAQHVHTEPPRRGARYSIDHMTHYTPLQDYQGIITPARLHFMQQHSSEYPEISWDEHRLTVHGLVDRPLSFSMDDLKRLPSVSRVHFVECHANSAPARHNPSRNPNLGMPVQYIHGMASNSEWSGVPFSVLLNEAGVKPEGAWLVLEGGDAGKFSHTLPTLKATEDCFVAYGQNGDSLRVEQGYPIRAIVPGWEGPFNVKYLRHIKVVSEPYNTWNESMNHSVTRPDLGGKARWYHFQWGPKSLITRPSPGLEMRKGYVQITGLAWSGAGRVAKVDVSVDGGKTWKEAKIDGAVHSKAHTRFNYDWQWNGEEATIMSRVTDETGDVQPALAELTEHWGMKASDWHDAERSRAIHMNAIQPWKIARDGSITDAMFV